MSGRQRVRKQVFCFSFGDFGRDMAQDRDYDSVRYANRRAKVFAVAEFAHDVRQEPYGSTPERFFGQYPFPV